MKGKYQGALLIEEEEEEEAIKVNKKEEMKAGTTFGSKWWLMPQ